MFLTRTIYLTVNHDDLWSFESRRVSIHWHNDLEIKGVLCEIFNQIFRRYSQELTRFLSANQPELERLEKMLNYLNTHFAEVIALSELANQVHLSREVCCRLFKKMTGKTITGCLEEYRANNPGEYNSLKQQNK